MALKQKNQEKKKNRKPPVSTRWLTSDKEEIKLRRARAEYEDMRVAPLESGRGQIFQNYAVTRQDHDDAQSYTVELRSLDAPVNTCTCADFEKNFLGTCKHIERVLMTIKQPRQSRRRKSPRTELYMTREPYAPMLELGTSLSDEAAPTLFRHINALGRLRRDGAAALELLLEACDALAARDSALVRVSAEVRTWLETLKTRELLRRLEHRYRGALEKSGGKATFLHKPLYPYQIDGMLHLAFKGRALLADEMGLGKTVQAIAAAAALREEMGVKRVLVVAPASLKAEWEEQIRIFTSLSHEVLFGLRHERIRRYNQTKAFFLIANYEQVMRDHKEINAAFKPDLVILDEAQRIKNWRTKTAQNLKRLDTRFAFVLTGTPIENRIDEIYSIAEFVQPTLLGSLFRFNRRFYQFDSHGKVIGMQNLEELYTALGTIMLRRRKDEIDEQLPERSDKNYFVGMTAEQSERYAEYEQIVAALCTKAKKQPLRPEEMERLQNALACMRMCCDTCYILDGSIRDAPKVDELVLILEDIWGADPERKVLIFSEWVRMLELVEERLQKRRVEYALHIGSVPQKERRQEILRFKEDPDCRVFLSSEAGGVGLNLQAASVVINLDLPWNPAKLEQRIARAWRKHQKNRVNVINIVSEGTLEQRMLGTLRFKQGLSDAVLDARGAFADFEQEGARGKFMERLAEVMDSPLRAPDAVDKPSQAAVIPPEERLAAKLQVENPGISRCDVSYGGEPGEVKGVLAVGHAEAAEPLRHQVEESHGVALPTNRVVVITPETEALLRQLAELGFITIRPDAAKTLFDTGSDVPPAAERLRQCARALDVLDKARHALRMAQVLAKAGFDLEAREPARKSVAHASIALSFLTAHAAPPDDEATLGDSLLDALRDSGLLDDHWLAIARSALPGASSDDATLVAQAGEFIEYCAASIEKARQRAGAL